MIRIRLCFVVVDSGHLIHIFRDCISGIGAIIPHFQWNSFDACGQWISWNHRDWWYKCKKTKHNKKRVHTLWYTHVHDGVIKWNPSRYWPFVRGIHRSPVDSPHKGQRRGALMLSLMPEQTAEQTVQMLAIWDAMALIVTSLWCHYLGHEVD